MPYWLFKFICMLMFSLAALMACLMLWPIYPGRPVPTSLSPDAIGIGLLALALGACLSLLFDLTAER